MSEDIKDLLKMLVLGFFIRMAVIMCFVTPGHCSVGKKSDTTCWLPERAGRADAHRRTKWSYPR